MTPTQQHLGDNSYLQQGDTQEPEPMKGRSVPKHMLIETHSNPSDSVPALQDHIATVSDGRRRRGSRRSKGSAVLKTAMLWQKIPAVWWQSGADASRIER